MNYGAGCRLNVATGDRPHLRRSESSAHLLKDVGRGHETEADGLHDGVRVPPAPPVVPQPRLHCFVQLDFWEATQSVAVQVRLDQTQRGRAGLLPLQLPQTLQRPQEINPQQLEKTVQIRKCNTAENIKASLEHFQQNITPKTENPSHQRPVHVPESLQV